MTDILRAEITKELIRAQDALHAAFQAACRANNLDLANDLRKQRKAIGERITDVNGGPVKLSKHELMGALS